MTIRIRRPTEEQLVPLTEQGRQQQFGYEPVGLIDLDDPPSGYKRDRWERALGTGDEVFGAATLAIDTWRVHRGSGLVVSAAEPPTVGGVVALSAPLPLGWVDAVCRVVRVIDEPGRAGFVYGTLADHPEQGEESFIVTRSDRGEVVFEITAVSRPRHLLARMCPPAARVLQRWAAVRYLDAMEGAVQP